MTLPVYVDPDLSAACVGETIRLDGDEARHAATVRRTRVGERIGIVNGKGLRATITVTDVAKSSLVGTVEHVANDPAHNPQITLVQALAKGGRDEQAVETATEYGADAFIPWQSERSIVSWSDPAKARKGVGRWEATAQSAAKQSRRSWIPTVDQPHSSASLARHIADFCADGGVVYICHESATTPITTQLDSSSRKVMIVVGPEGGITDKELELLTNAGGRVVLLGEHVLRSATAGPWAIAVIRA